MQISRKHLSLNMWTTQTNNEYFFKYGIESNLWIYQLSPFFIGWFLNKKRSTGVCDKILHSQLYLSPWSKHIFEYGFHFVKIFFCKPWQIWLLGRQPGRTQSNQSNQNFRPFLIHIRPYACQEPCSPQHRTSSPQHRTISP